MVRLKQPKSLKEKLQQKGLIKFIVPKASQAATNFLQLGPRVIMRSAIHLVRVNPLTRLISVLSLVVIDIVLYFRKQISRTQLIINLIFSVSMLIGSTIGWYTGQGIAAQLAFDFILGLVISLITTILGIQIFNKITEKLTSKIFTTDVQKGVELVNEYMCDTKINTECEITQAQALEVFRSQPYHTKVIVKILEEDTLLSHASSCEATTDSPQST